MSITWRPVDFLILAALHGKNAGFNYRHAKKVNT